VVLRPSASLLRQTTAVLPFFTLDGLRRLPPRYVATARHSSLSTAVSPSISSHSTAVFTHCPPHHVSNCRA
jgi:hypothetical protein